MQFLMWVLEHEGRFTGLMAPAPKKGIESHWIGEPGEQRLEHIPGHKLQGLEHARSDAPKPRPGRIGAQESSVAVQKCESGWQPIKNLLKMRLNLDEMMVRLGPPQRSPDHRGDTPKQAQVSRRQVGTGHHQHA